jgi:hypothetical protein
MNRITSVIAAAAFAACPAVPVLAPVVAVQETPDERKRRMKRERDARYRRVKRAAEIESKLTLSEALKGIGHGEESIHVPVAQQVRGGEARFRNLETGAFEAE